MNKKKNNKKKGFTLIEMLVAVLILAILVAIAAPTYFRAVEKSRASDPINTLKSIAKAEQVQRLRTGEYTNQAQDLDIQLRDFPAGNTVAGDTFQSQFFDYKVYGEDEACATASRKSINDEDFYELSVDYGTGEIFCRPATNKTCMDLQLEEGQIHGRPVYDTHNIQDWDLREFINYARDVLGELWDGSTSGNDLHCMQEETQNLCSDDGNGTCLNRVWGNSVTGADGNKYYWGTVYPSNLALHINDYAARPFFAQILFRSNGIFLVGNVNHNGHMIDELAQEMGLTDSNPHGDWVEYRIK